MKPALTAEAARKCLSYNPETGVITSPKTGRVMGIDRGHGYLLTCISSKRHMNHRLAWLMVHGEFPAEGMFIDHINGIRSDNRISNLRLASLAENNRNTGIPQRNKTGVKGVSQSKGKFRAAIMSNGVRVRATFATIEAAAAFSKAARESLHGEFCRHA